MKKGLKIIIVVVVAVILISTAFLVLYHPAHPFTDTSQTAAPEELDPATGFFTTNGPLFAAVFQSLVEYNGSSLTIVPVWIYIFILSISDIKYPLSYETDTENCNTLRYLFAEANRFLPLDNK